jgi:hypothetical protein
MIHTRVIFDGSFSHSATFPVATDLNTQSMEDSSNETIGIPARSLFRMRALLGLHGLAGQGRVS